MGGLNEQPQVTEFQGHRVALLAFNATAFNLKERMSCLRNTR